MDRGELGNHPGTSWVVECMCKLDVSVLQQPEDIQVAFMMTPRRICAQRFELLKSPFAEPLKSQLSEFAKNLPVGFRKVVGLHFIAA